jgi:hypothetical protein
MNDMLSVVFGFATIVLFGAWRNAVWRRLHAESRAWYFERDRNRLQALLYRAIGIDEGHSISVHAIEEGTEDE